MEKKIIYLSYKVKNKNHAGSKAVNDIDYILSKREDTSSINLFVGNKFSFFTSAILVFFILLIKKNKLLFVQETGSNRIHFLLKAISLLLGFRKHIFVGIIHDLINLREGKNGDEEKNIIKIYNFVISHNSNMSKYLVEKGFEKGKIVELELFDYIVEKTYYNKENNINKKEIVFAGNLSRLKSGFIYDFDYFFNNEVILLMYGVNYDADNNNKFSKYMGTFSPEILPNKITGSYGLVWDGSSIETCSGLYGEYMKYNNPHKISLYIVSELPVIIWGNSALASFVIEENIGIAVNNLKELPSKLNEISDSKYNDMKHNTKVIASKLKDGYFSNKAINKIIEIVQKN